MPEISEIAIMAEFMNKEFSHRHVNRVEKSPMSKNKCDLSRLDEKIWTVTSKSRGKEIMFTFKCDNESHSIRFGFARIGTIEYFDNDKIDQDYLDKRGMLRFYTEDRVYFLSDFTRYVYWKWDDKWHHVRGPDPYFEHNEWRDFMYRHRKDEFFNNTVFDVIINQIYFNGVGTFTRTEILARTRFSPFMNFKEVLESDILREDLFVVVKETIRDIIEYGGLQHKFWRNPNGTKTYRMNRWIRFYNKIRKAYYLKDRDKRVFWFDKKYRIDYIKWVDTNEIQDTRLLKKIYRKTNKQKIQWR